MAKSSLNSAKKIKNDEFYTQFSDIERECNHYTAHFKGKTVFCNCDDPFTSDFFKYFAVYFNEFGLKRLIAASYDPSPIAGTQLPFDEIAGMKGSDKKAYIFDASEMPNNLDDTKLMMKTVKEVVRPLQGNGDFRSPECIELLKQADIVVTNPPFSLFREYVAQLVEYDKKFLIIGNKNAITYKEVFELVKENKMWVGTTPMGIDMLFSVPGEIAQKMVAKGNEGSQYRIVNGKVFGRSPSMWFTNLDHKKRHEELLLYKTYNPTEYPRYDNYDAIEVGKTTEIPVDFDGVMGLPISFLDKYNPDQFVILDCAEPELKQVDAERIGVQMYQSRTVQRDGYKTRKVYHRIFIRRKV